MKTKQKAIILVVLIAIVAFGFLAYNFSAGGSLSIISSAAEGCQEEQIASSWTDMQMKYGISKEEAKLKSEGFIERPDGIYVELCPAVFT